MLICLCAYVNKRIVYSRPVACLRPDGCVCGRRRKRDACRGPRQGSAWTCAGRPRDWPRILIYLAYKGLRRLLNGSGPLGECQGTREPSNASRGVISKQATPKATTRSEVREIGRAHV